MGMSGESQDVVCWVNEGVRMRGEKRRGGEAGEDGRMWRGDIAALSQACVCSAEGKNGVVYGRLNVQAPQSAEKTREEKSGKIERWREKAA